MRVSTPCSDSSMVRLAIRYSDNPRGSPASLIILSRDTPKFSRVPNLNGECSIQCMAILGDPIRAEAIARDSVILPGDAPVLRGANLSTND